jgi:hypothetical protein
LTGRERKKGEVGGSLDFVEEGLYDIFWALVVALRERLGDKVLVVGRDVRHVVAGRDDLCLVRWVLDVVLDVFQFCFQVTHNARRASSGIRTFFANYSVWISQGLMR